MKNDNDINFTPISKTRKSLRKQKLTFSNSDLDFFPHLFQSNDFENLSNHIKNGYIIGDYCGKKTLIYIETAEIDLKNIDPNILIHKASKRIFEFILINNFREHSCYISNNYRRFLYPKSSAILFDNFIPRMLVACFFILIISFCIFSSYACIFCNFIYLTNTASKFFLYYYGSLIKHKTTIKHYSSELPIYSILVPLYKESFKVQQICKNLNNLDYPKNKLDIKIIVEEDDHETNKALRALKLEDWFQIIKVPSSELRTKPRACNYALSFVKGEFVTIYDAEDRPEPNQLKKIVHKFNSLDENYACIQAKLRIEEDGSMITKFFHLEYEMLFSFFLVSLCALNLPIPLGGTSNHFKVDVIKNIGMWDPYNVTEDAELGIKLSDMGYKVGMVDSYTYEEGHISVFTWIRQRVRWCKGFIITLALFLCTKNSKMRLIDKLSVILFLGFSILSFVMGPLILICMMCKNCSNNILWMSLINLIAYLSFFSKICHGIIKKQKNSKYYGRINQHLKQKREKLQRLYYRSKNNKKIASKIYIQIEKLSNKHGKRTAIIILLFPFYFCLHWIATYMAILELLHSPFHWNKTQHYM